MRVKMDQPVRLPDGGVTTIAALADQKRIRFTRSDNWVRRSGNVGTIYRAELIDSDGLFWEISAYAYQSRSDTGEHLA